jgi:hypothetical protein
MMETKHNKTLTWEELDKCETADAIADLLRRHGVRGVPGQPEACPLAVATGWSVSGRVAWLGEHRLTPAESAFVARVDAGEYPDLAEVDPREYGEGA